MDPDGIPALDVPTVIFAWSALILDVLFFAHTLRSCIRNRTEVLDKLRVRLRSLCAPRSWCAERRTAEDQIVADGVIQQRLRMARGYAKLLSAVSVITVVNVQWNIIMQNPRWMSTFLVWVVFFVAVMSTIAYVKPEALTPGNLDWWYSGGMLAVLAAMSPVSTSPDQAVLVSLVGLAVYRLPAVTFATRQWLVVLLNLGFVAMYLVRTQSEDFVVRAVELQSVYVTMWLEIMNFMVICVVSFFLQSTLKRNMKQTVQYGKATKELNAASSLLQLICDAVVELDEDLRLVAHSPELAGMLIRTRPGYSLEGVCFTDFIASPAEAARAEEILLSNTNKESDDSPNSARTWADDSTAHAFHTRLMDSCSSKFRTEIFRVRYQGLDGRVRQLLGLRDFTDDPALAASAIDAASPARTTPLNSASVASFCAPSCRTDSSDNSARQPPLPRRRHSEGSLDSRENQQQMQIAHLELDVVSETVTAASTAVAGLEGRSFAEVFTNQGMEVMQNLWKDVQDLHKRGVLAGKSISIGDLQVSAPTGLLRVNGHVEMVKFRGGGLGLVLCFKVPFQPLRMALQRPSPPRRLSSPYAYNKQAAAQEIVPL